MSSQTELYDNWADVFYSVSPHAWGYLGVAFVLGLSILGASWYVFNIQGNFFNWFNFIRIFCKIAKNSN